MRENVVIPLVATGVVVMVTDTVIEGDPEGVFCRVLGSGEIVTDKVGDSDVDGEPVTLCVNVAALLVGNEVMLAIIEVDRNGEFVGVE